MNKLQVVEAVIKGVGDAMNRVDSDARRHGTDPNVFAEGLLDGLTNCLAIVATNTTYKYPPRPISPPSARWTPRWAASTRGSRMPRWP